MSVAAEARPRSARTSFGKLAYVERPGEGTPLVLLHGVGGNSGAWVRQWPAFGSRRMIAWDAPGYGDSDALAGDAPPADDYASACVALLDALEVERAIVLGHSFGGLIAARMAARYPERVSRLLLTACSAGHARHEPARREQLLRDRLASLGDGSRGEAEAYARSRVPNLLSPTATAELIEQAVQVMARLRRDGFRQANRMISTADIFEWLPRITAPACVICGTSDRVTPPALNARIAAELRQAELVCIEGAGHWLFLEHADEFNRAVDAFVHRGARICDEGART